MKRWKVYLCAAVFLLLTAVKMIAPAAAADAREVLLPAINADDDYKSVFAEIRSVFAPAPVQTQDEQLRQYLPAVNMSVWSTPAPEPTPTPTPEPTPEPTPTPTPEPTQSPQLQAALAAREAFLNEQAVYSGYAVPTNVSYAVSELPFAHGVSGRGLYLVRLRLPAAPAGKQGEISLRHRLRGQFRHGGLCLC